MFGGYIFEEQLRELGYKLKRRPEGVLIFDYEVEVGPLAGDQIKLGFYPPALYPLTPPTGPLVSPRILPINRYGSKHPFDKIHPARIGGLRDPNEEWQYWSRPFPDWPSSDRNARSYMSHVRRLFADLPDDL